MTCQICAGLSDLVTSSASSEAASWSSKELPYLNDPALLEAVLIFAAELAGLAVRGPSELLSPHGLELYPGGQSEMADPWWLGYTQQVGIPETSPKRREGGGGR
jgi:hypothetical protein